MAKPDITEDDVRWTHRYMGVPTPYDAMSALVRRTVESAAGALAPRLRWPTAKAKPVDLKRRAAGDFDD
ncbi:hypothetical protein BL243_07815 [Ralstonia solanacearum]|nr:hypothetical protein BL243_07815 [Ralstonia solanacearum]